MTEEQFDNLPDQERFDLLKKHKDNLRELFSDYDDIQLHNPYTSPFQVGDFVAAKKRIEELEKENMQLKNDCFDLAYANDFLTKQFAFNNKRVELLEKENEKLKSTIEERDVEIERRAHAANHNAHLCEIARAEIKVLEEKLKGSVNAELSMPRIDELKPFLYWVFHKADRTYIEHRLGWRENAVGEIYDDWKNSRHYKKP